VRHSHDIVAGTLIGLAALLVYYFSALAIAEEVLPKTYDYAFNLAIYIAAAFSGAWFAFQLQNRKARKDTDAREVAAANNAIFELSRWYNKLHVFKKQFIDAHRNNPMRHFLILPAAGMSLGQPKIDYESISFIFRSSNPNILGTISLAEQEVASTIDVINQRSKFHVEELQPVVEQLEKHFGPSLPGADLEEEFGKKNTQVLKMLTDCLVEGVDASISALRENIDKLKAETESMHPGHAVIGMIDPPSVSAAAQ